MNRRQMKFLWPSKKAPYSRRMIASGIIVATGVWSFPPSSPLEYLWATASSIAFLYAYTLILKMRKCSHGLVCQSGYFFHLWAIDPCPKCGIKTFDD